MSVTPEKLRALQREAGLEQRQKQGPPSPQPSPPQAGERGLYAGAAGRPGRAASDPVSPARGGRWRAACAPAARARQSARAADAERGWGEGAALPADPTAARDTLRRLLGVRERAPLYAAPRGPVERSLPGDEIAPGLRLIEDWLPFPAPPAALPLAFAKRDDAVDPRDLLFFDTETTGLAGGTGTRAFQIGAADWHRHPHHGDGLRVRQLLITTLAAEHSMLATFAGWLTPTTVLSSYNGRCYDAPLLKTRYRLARMADPITPLDHVDLLFPTRRRYRGRWENCRLATIERKLLQIVREDDLPGAQAPAAWLAYLRGGPSTLLRRVCAHNHQDVVSLARLMLRLVAVDAASATT